MVKQYRIEKKQIALEMEKVKLERAKIEHANLALQNKSTKWVIITSLILVFSYISVKVLPLQVILS